jgi:hypothetical protein
LIFVANNSTEGIDINRCEVWGATMIRFFSTFVAFLRFFSTFAAFLVAGALAACGTYTPAKDPFTDDAPTAFGTTKQGNYESGIVNHVTCEIAQGLGEASRLNLPWLEKWGTTVTQTITVEDQTGLSPGISTLTPLKNVIFPFPTGGNVTSPQSFSLNFGITASANALRTETIQYTFRNKDILKYTDPQTCANGKLGIMIDGDLKIREFIYDKATIASLGNASLVGGGPQAWQLPVFNTFTEEITFVAAYGGSFTPTWKLARLSANTSSNLVVTERTNTNDLIITLGPLDPKQPKNGPVQLIATAMNQHNARVQAAAIAVSITGQSH